MDAIWSTLKKLTANDDNENNNDNDSYNDDDSHLQSENDKKSTIKKNRVLANRHTKPEPTKKMCALATCIWRSELVRTRRRKKRNQLNCELKR